MAPTLLASLAFASAIFFCKTSSCGPPCVLELGSGNGEPLEARGGVGDAEDDDAAAGEAPPVAPPGFWNFASLASTSARLAAISAAVYSVER